MILQSDICFWITRANFIRLGGYGMRYSFQKKMWAYTTQGDKAVLVQTDHERFMLGTQHPFQLVGAITRTPGSWTESFIAENAVIEKV